VKAKIPAHQPEGQAEISQVQHLFTRTDDEGEGDIDFLDDLQQDILIQTAARIHETTGKDSNDASADKEEVEESDFLDSNEDESDD
jgi:hypothetical protein